MSYGLEVHDAHYVCWREDDAGKRRVGALVYVLAKTSDEGVRALCIRVQRVAWSNSLPPPGWHDAGHRMNDRERLERWIERVSASDLVPLAPELEAYPRAATSKLLRAAMRLGDKACRETDFAEVPDA